MNLHDPSIFNPCLESSYQNDSIAKLLLNLNLTHGERWAPFFNRHIHACGYDYQWGPTGDYFLSEKLAMRFQNLGASAIFIDSLYYYPISIRQNNIDYTHGVVNGMNETIPVIDLFYLKSDEFGIWNSLINTPGNYLQVLQVDSDYSEVSYYQHAPNPLSTSCVVIAGALGLTVFIPVLALLFEIYRFVNNHKESNSWTAFKEFWKLKLINVIFLTCMLISLVSLALFIKDPLGFFGNVKFSDSLCLFFRSLCISQLGLSLLVNTFIKFFKTINPPCKKFWFVRYFVLVVFISILFVFVQIAFEIYLYYGFNVVYAGVENVLKIVVPLTSLLFITGGIIHIVIVMLVKVNRKEKFFYYYF